MAPPRGNQATNELSDFEKQRLENIAQRDALLRQLTLDAQSSGLFTEEITPRITRTGGGNESSTTATKRKRTSSSRTAANDKKKKKNVKKEEELEPRRVSSRLRGIQADSESKHEGDEKNGIDNTGIGDNRMKRTRMADSLSFNDMVVTSGKGKLKGGDSGYNSLIGGGVDAIKEVAKPYERTFTNKDISNTSNKHLKALREEMSGLKLWEEWEPNSERPSPQFQCCRMKSC